MEIRPSKQAVSERAIELVADDPALQARLARLTEFSRSVRTSEVFITDACNLRCQGCWFFGHDLHSQGTEVRSLDVIRDFAQQLRGSGVTHTLLLGGEPALVPDRIRAYAEVMPYVTVVTNGTRPVPRDGLEHINVAVSLWGGGPVDDELRGHRPNGSRIGGLFELGLAAYRDDPRVVWIFTVSEPGMPYLEETVKAIADNGNQLNFGYYSDYGTDPSSRIADDQRAIAEMTRLHLKYPETVIGHPYYFETLVTGRSHWGEFGGETCPSISVDHPAHADRVVDGHPVLRGFNTYRSDHTVQFCCTSGDCANCRDSQAVWTWLLVNMHRFLASREQLETWVTLAENFYRQFYWSPYRANAKG
ncbi:radical SAM protein [Kribbella italica]|uniref:MoaA/NifB/PqqE/SkfB family radical SAM enzyme n=1 Tax=Kribbella italica TaxID=1540520 RepID=A0A7W9JGQ7_9ACTN|nr:MoaA/NifB/PqqE/SkfB family radical SAM enzyme [Kribbella italica]